jgi:DNA-directed RNA polymerase specialized sigma24 family protein
MDRATCRIEALETFQEILDVLTPKQAAAIALRYAGYNDHEIAEELGLTHQAVSGRVAYARMTIARELPHLAPKLAGRMKESPTYRRDRLEK